jgi:sugar lactone lactonase YvrE
VTDRVECVLACANELGEAPIWCDRELALYWVDVRAPALHRYDPVSGRADRWALPDLAGSFAVRERGGMLLALRSGFHAFDPRTGAVQPLLDPEADQPDNRFNDGKCDRRGRFWAGTMRDVVRVPAGALYRLDPDLTCHRMLTGIVVPNSLAWSPDDRVMYFADTADARILAYPYDPDAGRLGTPRVLGEPGSSPGKPDGSTVDEAGCLWNARYGGGCVARYTPDGRLDRLVELPVTQVTSCAFGGRALDTLFITTATQRMTPEARAREPLAGGLFAVDVGVKGLPEPRFAG